MLLTRPKFLIQVNVCGKWRTGNQYFKTEDATAAQIDADRLIDSGVIEEVRILESFFNSQKRRAGYKLKFSSILLDNPETSSSEPVAQKHFFVQAPNHANGVLLNPLEKSELEMFEPDDQTQTGWSLRRTALSLVMATMILAVLNTPAMTSWALGLKVEPIADLLVPLTQSFQDLVEGCGIAFFTTQARTTADAIKVLRFTEAMPHNDSSATKDPNAVATTSDHLSPVSQQVQDRGLEPIASTASENVLEITANPDENGSADPTLQSAPSLGAIPEVPKVLENIARTETSLNGGSLQDDRSRRHRRRIAHLSDGSPKSPRQVSGNSNRQRTVVGSTVAFTAPAKPPERAFQRRSTPAVSGTVLVFGDSLASGLGPSLSRAVRVNGAQVLSIGRVSTGLSRLDFFNWGQELDRVLHTERVDIAVVLIGANDPQGFVHEDRRRRDVFRTPAWLAAYTQRVMEVIDRFRSRCIPLIWVGLPIMRDNQLSNSSAYLNGIYRQAAAETGIPFVDLWPLTTGADGEFTAYLTGQDSRPWKLRSDDGVHFSSKGYDWIADAILPALSKPHMSSGQTCTDVAGPVLTGLER